MPFRRPSPAAPHAARLTLATLVAAAAVAAPLAGYAAPARRVALLSVDGGGAQMLGRAVAAGLMPNLAAIQAAGATAERVRTTFPSKTASGHAALWTGAFPSVNGVSANSVPLMPPERHTILEAADGFKADALQAEPLFVSAARAGKRVYAFDLAQSTPFEAYGPGGRFGEGLGGRLRLANGFLGVAGGDGAWSEKAGLGPADAWTSLPRSNQPPRELVGKVADRPLYALLYADPEDPATGYDTVLLSWTREAAAAVARLKPRPPRDDQAWSGPVRVDTPKGRATSYFRLFHLDPAGGKVLLYHTAPTRVVTNYATDEDPGFVVGGALASYGWGRLGATVADGGDGRAEEYYLATVRFALGRASQRLAAMAGKGDWDLMMAYLPWPDEAAHAWYGYLVPGSPAYDKGLAARLRPAFDGMLAELDKAVGALRLALPADAALVVVGDHGMAPVRWDFKPNVVLRRAGLLAVGPDGHVDLRRTRAMYAVHDGAYVVVNTTDHRGGVVPPAQAPAVIAEVRKALGTVTVKTPAGVVPLVRAWVEPTGEAMADLGIGGRAGGQLYLDLQPGYDFDPDPTGEALFKARHANSSGAHVFDPRRPEIHACFYAAGAGIKPGVRLPEARTIDVAPTVSRLLGIRPPAQASGRVLAEVLAE